MTTSFGPRVRTAGSLSFLQVLGRLLLAGLVAGLLAAGWLLTVTEPVINAAIELEEARHAGAPGSHTDAISRETQLAGGVLASVITGVVLGVVFAAVYGTVRHRLPGRSDVTRASLLAAVGFAVVGLLPAVVVPANPPGVGDPATVGSRTAVYGTVLLCGVVTAVVTGALVGFLRDRGFDTASTAVAATVLALGLVVLVVLVVRHSPDVAPDDVPAGLVWEFRLASLGQLLVLWTALGLVGGRLLDRAAARPRS
jgi:predicted cobalt transporter CbtA